MYPVCIFISHISLYAVLKHKGLSFPVKTCVCAWPKNHTVFFAVHSDPYFQQTAL